MRDNFTLVELPALKLVGVGADGREQLFFDLPKHARRRNRQRAGEDGRVPQGDGRGNANRFAAAVGRLQRDYRAALVHVGRGQQLVQKDLLNALDSGHLSEAVLDVTEPEPLPDSDPLWDHPRVTLTPHIASMTQPDSAVEVVLQNIRRFHAGEPMTGLVEKARGY